MKTLSLLFTAATLLFSCSLFAQNPNLIWAKQVDGTNYVQSTSIAIDAEGNILSTGYFLGTVDFDPSDDVFELTSLGGGNTFILKLTSEGDFIWAKQLESIDYQYATCITSDAEGNCYTVGGFNGQIDFDPNEGVQLFNSNSPAVNGFILKLDGNGEFIWAKQFDGEGMISGNGVVCDTENNVYNIGIFDTTIDVDPGDANVSLSSMGQTDSFIVKLDPDGEFTWVSQIGGPLNQLGYTLATDNNDHVYSVGNFAGTADFDPSENTFNLTAAEDFEDLFIQKLSGTIATDIGENTIGSKVSLYPNPFNEVISIVGKESLGRIQVSNLFGQLVLDVQTPDASFVIPTEQWSNGVYIVTVKDRTMKVVK